MVRSENPVPVNVQQHQSVPLQPRLETDMLTGGGSPEPARKVTFAPRPAKRPDRSDILERAVTQSSIGRRSRSRTGLMSVSST